MKYKYQLLLTIALLWSCHLFAYDVEIDGLYYNLLSPNSVEVTSGNTKPSGYITIPDSIIYNGKIYEVVSVGNNAFEGCTDLKSIKMGKKITKIGKRAFKDCSSLSSYSFNASEIGEYVFENCTSITSFRGGSLKILPEGMFYGCTSLSSFSCRYDTKVGKYAFCGCTALTSLKLVNAIGDYAFKDCTGITSVTLMKQTQPVGETTLGNGTFEGCSSLKTLTIDEKNPYGAITNIGRALYKCESLDTVILVDSKEYSYLNGALYRTKNYQTNLEIVLPNQEVYVTPSYISEIWSTVFIPGKLRRVVLSGNIQKISSYAFNNCSNLSEIYCYSSTPYKVGTTSDGIEFNSVFSTSIYTNVHHYVPKGAIDNYKSSSSWNKFASIEEFDISTFDPYTTSINNVQKDNDEVDFYTINGVKKQKPIKGLNIIRMKDGATKKIIIK